MNITIPELSLVLLIGISGAGKSTFARKHFKPTEVISSDACRGLVSDDENNQAASQDAFEILHFIAKKRLAAGRLTVIDATNVQVDARKSLIELAKEYHVPLVALVFDIAEELCLERNVHRPNRSVSRDVIRRQSQQLQRSLPHLKKEGFRFVYSFSTPESLDTVVITRHPLRPNRKYEHGPFDIIGDVHGCFDELTTLLNMLGYRILLRTVSPNRKSYVVQHPAGRKVIFLGDIVDRGPRIPDVLRLVMDMVDTGIALCVPGNHDMRLLRQLKGQHVMGSYGLAQSVEQLKYESPAFIEQVITFLDDLTNHYVLDHGNLVVAHAGMKAEMQGRSSRKVRDFALYGETTGETDEFGLPVRYNWAADYRGHAMVVYGHTPVPEPTWLNRTINVDTGCVFGGRLTALRYPEREIVSVDAARVYCEPTRPLNRPTEQDAQHSQHRDEDILDLEDVLGKRRITTRLMGNITIQEQYAIAALEVMSRFAINPRWLIYLPPTMAPTKASQLPGLLEHPSESFAYYQQQGVTSVICQEKHMGSRMVMIVCRDEQAAQKRFGVNDNRAGICYTRTGRHFFGNRSMESQMLAHVRSALDQAGIWESLHTDWVCLDGELLPWSAKAQELLQTQYAAVAAAANRSITDTIAALERVAGRDSDAKTLLINYRERLAMIHNYRSVYRRYCWDVQSIADLQFAPFHLLASEGAVHTDKNHEWHMQTLATICQTNPNLLKATSYRIVNLSDLSSQAAAIRWWEELTRDGGEGIVVKPLAFIEQGLHGLVQPAVKCRGREYLRIIYGPEYTQPSYLEQLRSRSLGLKRSLAMREFALGIEALEQFVRHEPLYRVHECVFGILALESEPVDPRL